ncbi:MAG: hypothetical protein K2G60_02065 [Oscillospiraceae bacterium]|nr:hypothetical protein [Oscillospiraceae bacterium]
MSIETKHFADLSRRAENSGRTIFSDFLGLSELSELKSMRLSLSPRFWGGFPNAERVIASFGECEYEDYPICLILIKPVNKKFADELSHRDFLGSIMALGIKRDVIGDIIVNENCGYVFCIENIADYITENLKEIKHTTVKAERYSELPSVAVPEPETAEYIVSSRRLDVLTAAVFNLSRKSAGELFTKKRVFVNGCLKNAPYTVLDGDSITVRGFGKFVFVKENRRTKKDRAIVEIKLYK